MAAKIITKVKKDNKEPAIPLAAQLDVFDHLFGTPATATEPYTQDDAEHDAIEYDVHPFLDYHVASHVVESLATPQARSLLSSAHNLRDLGYIALIDRAYSSAAPETMNQLGVILVGESSLEEKAREMCQALHPDHPDIAKNIQAALDTMFYSENTETVNAAVKAQYEDTKPQVIMDTLKIPLPAVGKILKYALITAAIVGATLIGWQAYSTQITPTQHRYEQIEQRVRQFETGSSTNPDSQPMNNPHPQGAQGGNPHE